MEDISIEARPDASGIAIGAAPTKPSLGRCWAAAAKATARCRCTVAAVAFPSRSGCWASPGRSCAAPRVPELALMFFFSIRLGCLGSLLISVLATLLLLLILGVINLD